MSKTVKENLLSLIAFNEIIEKSLSLASNFVEQDDLSSFFLDLAWEKNRFAEQLRKEITYMEGLSKNIITLNKLPDFIEFETSTLYPSVIDLKYVENVQLSIKTISANYTIAIAINSLSASCVMLLKSQQERIEHGLSLLQNYSNEGACPNTAIIDLIA